MHLLMSDLFPICRSITGQGVRQSLKILQSYIPLKIHEVPSGTRVFDWTIPLEWNIEDAYIKNSSGERIVDFKQSNLHVVNYSQPVQAKMRLAQLRPHLHSLPEFPDWIPYRTSYYQENWGFCMPHNRLKMLRDDEDYEVSIQSTFSKGQLTYGELYIPGQTEAEVLISSHVCHPSLCNDNLSGMVIATFLAKFLQTKALQYSYRVVFAPSTIGSIVWLCRNEQITKKIRHGFVLTGLGDPGGFTYKKSRMGNADIDRAFAYILQNSGYAHKVIDFFPYGYDERQYCSPGFNLPIGCFMRTPHGQYPEYHTSGDNLEFVQPQCLEQSLDVCLKTVELLEKNKTYQNLSPQGEPQLGRRGLYRAVGGQADGAKREMGMLWILNLSDGTHSLLDIAERSTISFDVLSQVAQVLVEHHLLKEIDCYQ